MVETHGAVRVMDGDLEICSSKYRLEGNKTQPSA